MLFIVILFAHHITSYHIISGKCNFPKSYPTGCLLGCVDIVDCLPQEEYKIQVRRILYYLYGIQSKAVFKILEFCN